MESLLAHVCLLLAVIVASLYAQPPFPGFTWSNCSKFQLHHSSKPGHKFNISSSDNICHQTGWRGGVGVGRAIPKLVVNQPDKYI